MTLDSRILDSLRKVQMQNNALRKQLREAKAEMKELRERVPAEEPSEGDTEAAWEKLVAEACRIEREDRKKHGQPRGDGQGGKMFVLMLKREGFDVEQVQGLVRGSAEMASRLRQPTLREEMQREREARRRGLDAIKGDEAALDAPDPSCVEYGANPQRDAQRVVETGKRLGVLRK